MRALVGVGPLRRFLKEAGLKFFAEERSASAINVRRALGDYLAVNRKRSCANLMGREGTSCIVTVSRAEARTRVWPPARACFPPRCAPDAPRRYLSQW